MSADRGAAPEPKSLKEKVQFMLHETFPDQKVSARTFAQIVKDKGGSLSHATMANILSGVATNVSDDTLKALGLGFGVDWRYFKPESEVEAEVLSGLTFLAKKRAGEIDGVAGRGIGDAGLPSALLQFALGLVEQETQRRAQQAGEPTAQ